MATNHPKIVWVVYNNPNVCYNGLSTYNHFSKDNLLNIQRLLVQVFQKLICCINVNVKAVHANSLSLFVLYVRIDVEIVS